MKTKILKESENLELQDYIRNIRDYGDGFITLEKIDFDIYHAPYNFTVDDVVREARRYGFKLGYVEDEGYGLISSNNVNEELIVEKENPENREINKRIKDVLLNKSNATSQLKKMGYDIKVDDEAKKEFGRNYFGQKVEITNPKTGRKLYGDEGRKYGNPTLIARGTRPDEDKETIFHRLASDTYSLALHGDKDKFDYKSFLDKEIPENDSDKLTTVQQFKKDRQFLKQNELTAKQIDNARARINDIRSRYNLKAKNENLNTELDNKAREVVNPVYADAIKGIKRADKMRDEARKLQPAPKTTTPKPVKSDDLKKMHLSENLFTEALITWDDFYNLFSNNGYSVRASRDGDMDIYVKSGEDEGRRAKDFEKAKELCAQYDLDYTEHVGGKYTKSFLTIKGI